MFRINTHWGVTKGVTVAPNWMGVTATPVRVLPIHLCATYKSSCSPCMHAQDQFTNNVLRIMTINTENIISADNILVTTAGGGMD